MPAWDIRFTRHPSGRDSGIQTSTTSLMKVFRSGCSCPLYRGSGKCNIAALTEISASATVPVFAISTIW